MRPIGKIPSAPRFQLESHQLAQVLCQIRFSPVLRILQDDSVIAFQEEIRQSYPRYAKQQAMALLLTPDGVQQQTAAASQHRFDDSEGIFTAILSSDFVALETTRYTNVDDFVDRVVALAQTVQTHYAPVEIQRVGLRFINELRFAGPDTNVELRAAVNTTLLGAAGSDELVDVVTGAQQILELAGDDSRMLVRHGLQPRGTTTIDRLILRNEPVPELAHPFYLLDIDAYVERSTPFSVDGIEVTLRRFNDDIRSFFAWGVHEEYRRTKLRQRDG